MGWGRVEQDAVRSGEIRWGGVRWGGCVVGTGAGEGGGIEWGRVGWQGCGRRAILKALLLQRQPTVVELAWCPGRQGAHGLLP